MQLSYPHFFFFSASLYICDGKRLCFIFISFRLMSFLSKRLLLPAFHFADRYGIMVLADIARYSIGA